MNSVMEILFHRRPPLNYIAPSACEAILSGSSIVSIVLPSFQRIKRVGGLTVLGVAPGPFSLNWETEPGADPPVICFNLYQVVDGVLTLVAECVTPPPGGGGVPIPGGGTPGGSYVVTPVTPEGEGEPSDPITLPTSGGGGGENPPGECDETGDDTTCAYGATGEQYRIKGFNAGWFNIADCGLSWTTCTNCEIFPDFNCVEPQPWDGTFGTKVNDGQFIDQPFEPSMPCGGCPWPHSWLLHGFCISAQLATAAAPNSTGCGWHVTISAPFVGTVWSGIKSKGEGPVGKYVRIAGCCPGPECLEIEAY